MANKFAVTDWIWMALILFLILGWFYPPLGIVAVICMAAPVIYGFIKGGRIWCGSFCPRGSFLGKIIGRMSSKGKIPGILRSPYTRWGLLIFLFANFGWGIYKAQGNPVLIGLVFERIILITTLLAIVLGLRYQPRTWCSVCPMGTLSGFAAKAKKRVTKKENIKENKKEIKSEIINIEEVTDEKNKKS